MQDTRQHIKTLIIDTLNLDGMKPEDIDEQAPLFGEGLGLDSIDALELGLAIKKEFGVVLKADVDASRRHFYSVSTLAEFINEQQSGTDNTHAG